uniref:HotDog ACOT-type domain-containing protein n=1 Tax=Steinernema glaseri TaxID=37863 RepID=A0A1I8A4E0_9BILA
MQTTMRIYQQNKEGSLEQMLKAKFVMVSRNPEKVDESLPVHPLIYPTPEEALIFNQGIDDNLERSHMDAKSVFRSPPTQEEYQLIHEMFVQSSNNQGFASSHLPKGHVWLEDRPHGEMMMPCYPENKNVYGKIFGGFLMRQAFDLAAVSSKLFAETSTELIAVSDIVFRAPVEIGDVLSLAAHITFTHEHFIHVRVQAQVVNEKTFERRTTNTFHFTFTTRNKRCVPKIMPQAYKQAMLYINGRRHMQTALKYRGSQIKLF